jgi:hypothetical protein
MQKIDVFISRKSADAPFAKKIYDYLTAQGLSVFESDQSLKELGNADYIKAIDEALVSTTHMMVVGSSANNIKSSWVEAEWLFFLNRKRSGKTSGNLFTVITKQMNIDDLPPSLANFQVIPYNEKNFPIVYNYVKEPNSPNKKAPAIPYPAEKENKYLKVIILLISVLFISTLYFLNKYQNSVDITGLFDINTKKYNPAIHKEADVNLGNECTLFIHDTNIKYTIPMHNKTDASGKNLKVKFFLKYDGEYEEFDVKDPILFVPKNTEYIPLNGFISDTPIRKKPSEIIIYLMYENEFSPRKTIKKFIISEPKDIDDFDSSYFFENESKIKIADVVYLIDEEYEFLERKNLRKITNQDKEQREFFDKNHASATLLSIGYYALYERKLWAELKKHSTMRFFNFIEENKNRLLFETPEYSQFELTYQSEFVVLNEKNAIFRMKPLPNTNSSTYWHRVTAFKELNIANGITPFKNFYDYGFEVVLVYENGEWKIDLHGEYNGIPNPNEVFYVKK